MIKTLFLDLGGVLLTNGWDGQARTRAAEAFSLDPEETEERHHLTFDAWEAGKLPMKAYLDRVVFYVDRPFTHQEFIRFVFDQSQPHEEVIALLRNLKQRHGLRLSVITNDPREIVEYRIRTFGLREYIDSFIASAFVHYRKPDPDIFHVALDVAQGDIEEAVYIEDRAMFVDVARELGLKAIHHTGLDSTRAALAALGLD